MFEIATIRLKLVRHALDFTQEQMAKVLNISKSTYYRWEKGFPNIKKKHRDKLRHIGISPKWIDYGDGEPFIIEIKAIQLNIERLLKL